MAQQESVPHSTDAVEVFRSALKSQFLAGLATLRQAIEKCPADLWISDAYANPFWRIAYHTLYYAHLYMQPNAALFQPWEHHQTGIHDMDDVPAPREIQELIELPHRPPQTGAPYTKVQLLEYMGICERMVDGAVDAIDLLDPECGFSWYKMPKAEHQLVAIRHIQHHSAQLGVRLREAADVAIDWVGAGRS